jgi:4-hydroxybenzoate polyprenyltransferase
MTEEQMDKELDKPAHNTIIVIITYLTFGTYGMLLSFLFFAIGYIYQYYKNKNRLYRKKMISYFLYTLPIYTLLPYLWVVQ